MRGPVVARAPWGFQGMTSTEVNVGATLTAWPCKYDRRITARHRVLVVTLTLASYLPRGKRKLLAFYQVT